MVVNADDYDTQGAPRSWAKIFAMRHALTKYPESMFIWYLDQDAYIMDPNKRLEDQVTNPRTLEAQMIKDLPVVPPDSIIKTFGHLRGEYVDFIVSQDKQGLVHHSVVIRNGEWAKYFVETWFDPLYRSYNFQKAERHALVSTPLTHMGPSFANITRSTLFSGIRRSCRSSLSCRSGHLPPTHHQQPALCTRTAILSSCSQAAQRRDMKAAKRCQRHIGSK